MSTTNEPDVARRYAAKSRLTQLRNHPAGPVFVVFSLLLSGCILAGLLFPEEFFFLSPGNIILVLPAIPNFGLIDLGVGLLMIAGEFDLSVGSVYVVAPFAMIFAYVSGVPWLLAMALAFGIAILVGLMNGIITLSFGVPPFITTLGTIFIVRTAAPFIVGYKRSLVFKAPPGWKEVMTDMTAAAPQTAPQTPLFEARGISKSYGHVEALIDVNFEVRKNEVVGLLGDNGAGKSTLIKMLSGVVRPDKGQFLRNGEVVDISTRQKSEAAGIQTIYQDIALVRSMSIMRNIFAGREPTNRFGFLKMAEMRDTAMGILDEHVRIAGINSPDILVEQLSGGQAQAVAIARAVHFKRDILLLDEPTSALSVRETEKVLNIVRDLAESGVSCVFVTHNLYHAFRVCDRFAILAHGQNVQSKMKADTSLNELTDIIMKH